MKKHCERSCSFMLLWSGSWVVSQFRSGSPAHRLLRWSLQMLGWNWQHCVSNLWWSEIIKPYFSGEGKATEWNLIVGALTCGAGSRMTRFMWSARNDFHIANTLCKRKVSHFMILHPVFRTSIERFHTLGQAVPPTLFAEVLCFHNWYFLRPDRLLLSWAYRCFVMVYYAKFSHNFSTSCTIFLFTI